MQSSGTSPEFTPGVLAEISDHYLRQIDLGERHRRPFTCRFGRVVSIVNEHRHPLISRSVGIDRAATLPGRLDLDAFGSCFHRILRISALNDKMRMPIEVIVLGQNAGML